MKGLIKGILFMMLLTGCQAFHAQEDVKPMALANNAMINQNVADEAKQIVLSMEEVVEVKGVNENQNIYLAPQVKHFDRFRLKEIRKQGHDAVKKRFPDANVHLSTDKKIFIELEKLEQKLKNKQISEERLKEELKKLEEMMKGS
ncbi:YhcN/YlaJ family sporulation lipoprotein [Halalkalibacter nanhaiisediminis]|uniref:Sporulation lipoprotein YhcN/YlaJ n=1 Tax=Halalkalibacter nanhaiisediminis TaxID=688079 RepID=A0A562QD23_9BACI|nr:YhcN/YlaJ family sporulation lipoprotein [Halalkalibacter nanhaiisediminis]TWI54651.1 sporulation lipoprotein YhcN/YlaJ [Halalkalibacter nanhaiisediminis]